MTEAPFESFYEQTVSGMVARAFVLCGRLQDAEDAVAEAYEKAFRRWNRLARYESPEAWVYRVMQRRLWRMARGQAREVLGEVPGRASAAAGPEHAAEARRVLEALADLPPRQRQVLVLQCVCGLSQEEIRSELGLRTRSTVAAHVFKARRTLEKVLDLTTAPAGAHDAVGTGPGHALLPAAGQIDPLAAPLQAAEDWTRAMIESDPGPALRIRGRFTSAIGPGDRRRLRRARR